MLNDDFFYWHQSFNFFLQKNIKHLHSILFYLHRFFTSFKINSNVYAHTHFIHLTSIKLARTFSYVWLKLNSVICHIFKKTFIGKRKQSQKQCAIIYIRVSHYDLTFSFDISPVTSPAPCATFWSLDFLLAAACCFFVFAASSCSIGAGLTNGIISR